MITIDTPDTPGEAPENEAAKLKPATSMTLAELLTHFGADRLKSMPVTYKDQKAEITLAFDDGTADVQLVDDAGEAVRDGNGQPLWTPRVPLAELTQR